MHIVTTNLSGTNPVYVYGSDWKLLKAHIYLDAVAGSAIAMASPPDPSLGELVARGVVRRYEIPAAVKGDALVKLLRSAEFRVAGEAILTAIDCRCDGNSFDCYLKDPSTEDHMRALIDWLLVGRVSPVWDETALSDRINPNYWIDESLTIGAMKLVDEAVEADAILEVHPLEFIAKQARLMFDVNPSKLMKLHIEELVVLDIISIDEQRKWLQDNMVVPVSFGILQ